MERNPKFDQKSKSRFTTIPLTALLLLAAVTILAPSVHAQSPTVANATNITPAGITPSSLPSPPNSTYFNIGNGSSAPGRPSNIQYLEARWRPGLIIVSYLVATAASYSTVTMLQLRLSTSLVPLGAFTLSVAGIWSMHFVGMEALHLGVPMSCEPVLTTFSAVFAFICACAGMTLVHWRMSGDAVADRARFSVASSARNKDFTIRAQIDALIKAPHGVLCVSGLCIAAGVCCMHYAGMEAMQCVLTVERRPGVIAASVVIAVVAATAALYLAFVIPITRRFAFPTALVMGVAVCGMHYTGMYGYRFKVDVHSPEYHRAMEDAPRFAVSIMSPYIVCGSLIVSMLTLATTLLRYQLTIRDAVQRFELYVPSAIVECVFAAGSLDDDDDLYADTSTYHRRRGTEHSHGEHKGPATTSSGFRRYRQQHLLTAEGAAYERQVTMQASRLSVSGANNATPLPNLIHSVSESPSAAGVTPVKGSAAENGRPDDMELPPAAVTPQDAGATQQHATQQLRPSTSPLLKGNLHGALVAFADVSDPYDHVASSLLTLQRAPRERDVDPYRRPPDYDEQSTARRRINWLDRRMRPVHVTIMFVDVVDFTTHAEQMNQQTLLREMSLFNGRCTAAIEQTGGVVDKYLGDAIMAVWNGVQPVANHAMRGVAAALACTVPQGLASSFNGAASKRLFEAKAGLQTGPALMGNVGAATKMNFTVLGDTVNQASRIEGLTRHYGARVMIGQGTRVELGENGSGFLLRFLDDVMVKGKTHSVMVYEVLGDAARHNDIILGVIRSRAQSPDATSPQNSTTAPSSAAAVTIAEKTFEGEMLPPEDPTVLRKNEVIATAYEALHERFRASDYRTVQRLGRVNMEMEDDMSDQSSMSGSRTRLTMSPAGSTNTIPTMRRSKRDATLAFLAASVTDEGSVESPGLDPEVSLSVFRNIARVAINEQLICLDGPVPEFDGESLPSAALTRDCVRALLADDLPSQLLVQRAAELERAANDARAAAGRSRNIPRPSEAAVMRFASKS